MSKFSGSALAIGIALGVLQGCSLPYDLQQDAQQSACEKNVDWSARQECMNKNKKTFEEYERERAEVLKNKKN